MRAPVVKGPQRRAGGESNGGGRTLAPSKARKLSDRQQKLYELLCSQDGAVLSEAEILAATNLAPRSLKAYFVKGHYHGLLTRQGDGTYRVTVPANFSQAEFLRRVSQSADLRESAGTLREPLARALVRRSRENMIVALEVYNRPSLQNRIDAFALMFCCAWEQLLKAEQVERGGEASIFKPNAPGHRRETVSLQTCLQTAYPNGHDTVRRNVERIAEIRNSAAHLVVPELQPTAARLFQAGVINYARRYREFVGESLLPSANIGLMCLVGDERVPDGEALASLYGARLAEDMLGYARTLDAEMNEAEDERFAVRVDVRVRFARGTEDGDVTLVNAADAPTSAVVVLKPVDPERTHPLRTTELEERVRTLLKERGIEAFTRYTLLAILHKQGWKKCDNQYHRLQRNPDTPKYSTACAEEIVRLICADGDYSRRAVSEYRRSKGRR